MPMMSRGRYSQTNEWDDSSVFEPQYLDADNGGDLNLDHCRLYIKNLPKGLNEAGLYAAFAKFGTLYEAYLSPDPGKNFALVKYETPGEAKLAMMKMNNTEPLKLQIQIAKKSKAQSFRKNKYCPDKSTNDVMERSDRSHDVSNRDREDSGSISSRGRHSRSSKPMSARRRGPVTTPPSIKRRRRRKKRSEWPVKLKQHIKPLQFF